MRASVLCLWIIVGACATDVTAGEHDDAGTDAVATIDADAGEDSDGASLDARADAASERDARALALDAARDPPMDAGESTDLGAADEGTAVRDAARRDAGPTRCPPGPCDLERQVGCDAPYPVCDFGLVPEVGPSPYCRPLGGRYDGEPCNRMFGCVAGYSCVFGACRRLCCSGDSTLCPTGQMCIGGFVAPSEGGSTAGFCAGPDTCDPVLQTGCVPEEYCYIAGAGVTDCVPPGSIAVGATCVYGNDCVRGAICVNVGDMSQCALICGRGDAGPPACTEGRSCLAVTGFPDSLGVCYPF